MKQVSFSQQKSEKKKNTKSFADDFEPRPNVSAYGEDVLKGEKSSSFAKEIEPRPNGSAYSDDDDLKGEKSSSFAKDFEPRPNISAYYGDDGAGHKGEKKSFISEFVPKPNISTYHDRRVVSGSSKGMVIGEPSRHADHLNCMSSGHI
ncbi:hypothetical protein DITRI_Ditri16bG0070600 [Diplodiscus trichospermus]